MSNRPKQIGTAQETAVKLYLRDRGYVHAKRIVLHGTHDEGDLVLGDGYPVVIESKGGRSAVARIPGSLNELEAEIENAGAEFGFLVVKRAGTTDVGRYYAIVPVRRMVDLVERVWPPPHELAQPRVKVWRRIRSSA